MNMIIKIDTTKKEIEVDDDPAKTHTRQQIMEEIAGTGFGLECQDYDIFYSYCKKK